MRTGSKEPRGQGEAKKTPEAEAPICNAHDYYCYFISCYVHVVICTLAGVKAERASQRFCGGNLARRVFALRRCRAPLQWQMLLIEMEAILI